MVDSFYVLQVSLLCSLSSYSFDLGGHEDWTWPGSTFDGLTLGYGFPGWELPPPLPLPPPPFPPPVVHNHFHNHAPLDHDHHYYDHGPHGPHDLGHGFHGGHGYGYGYGHGYGSDASTYKDFFCHHARKMKHARKWLQKMLSCGVFF